MNDEQKNEIDRYCELVEQIKKLTKEKDKIKNYFPESFKMTNESFITGDEYVVYRTEVETARIDNKKLEKELGEDLSRFRTSSISVRYNHSKIIEEE